MVKINRLVTKVNCTKLTNKRNMWIVIHYVGAVSSAKANAQYFYGINRQASANYFVDEKEIWQVVEDKDAAWHVGGAIKYYNSCRNNNSIGIELCCKKDDNGNWYFESDTIQNAIELTKMLMRKYNIPLIRVCRHYDVTHKICPEPFVRNDAQWQQFLKRVEAYNNMADIPELSLVDKINKIKQVMNIDDNTIQYNKFYKYGVEYIDKQYKVCVDAEKWREHIKNG